MNLSCLVMQCRECGSTHHRKNGIKQGKQNHICVDCRRQLIDTYDPHRTYSDDIKQHCLELYVNGMRFRAIERVTGVRDAETLDSIATSLLKVPHRPGIGLIHT